MVVIFAYQIYDSNFVHLASTFEEGVKWILNHGQDWCEGKYCFLVYEVTVDKDSFYDEKNDNAYFIDLQGNMLKDNPLLN